MIICFRWKNPELVCFQNRTISLFENEANLFLLVCRIKGAAGKYPFRKEYGFSRESITQKTHQGFRYDQLLPLKMQSSLVPYCFRSKSAFLYNNMVAMVTIETPGFKPKRWLTLETPGFKPKQWLTLEKNFLVLSTMSLNHGNNYTIVITITISLSLGW